MQQLATAAAHAAARVRASLNIGATDTVCPFDIAASLGVKVWFVNGPSLEGIFTPDPVPTIVVSSQRPAGRQRFTCGHEIGHFVFQHGERIDEYSTTRRSPEEFVADRFSSALLMPKLAVLSAFRRWAVDPRRASPVELFCVCQDLGVGYATLIEYLHRTVKLLQESQSRDLLRRQPKAIKEELAGTTPSGDVFVVDDRWGARPVDLQQDDLVKVEASTATMGATLAREAATLIRAIRPGLTSVTTGTGRSIPVRVKRREYAGLSRYRYLDDQDE
jgi:Zn-dependent peptidase ImmA (M78 family)